MMHRAISFVASILLLHLPPEFEALVTALGTQAIQNRIPALPQTLQLVTNFGAAYYTACVKYIIVSIAIVNTILRGLAKPDSMTFTTLMGPDCAPMSWGAGVMSLFCGLASITLSFWNANQLRWVTLDNQSILIWMENAKRNATSPWKNASALLAAPSTLCIWSVVLYVLHLVTSSQCQSILDSTPGVDHISLPGRLSWFSTLVEPRTMKTVVVIAAFLLWTYTVHAMRAFAQLTPSLGYLSQV